MKENASTVMNTVKLWCVELLLDRLYQDWLDSERVEYGADLAFEITLPENNGEEVAVPCDYAEWLSFSAEAFREYVVPWCKDTASPVPTPYVDGEAHCAFMLYFTMAESLINNCEIVNGDNWNDSVVWTREKVITLTNELIEQVDTTDYVYADWFSWPSVKFPLPLS